MRLQKPPCLVEHVSAKWWQCVTMNSKCGGKCGTLEEGLLVNVMYFVRHVSFLLTTLLVLSS
jgi:hypothetical protein